MESPFLPLFQNGLMLINSLYFIAALAAFPVVKGNNSPAYRTGKAFLLFRHKHRKPIILHASAVFHKARPIPGEITFFQIFYLFTGIFPAFEAKGKLLLTDAVLNPAFSTMLRLSFIGFQASVARFFMIAVLVTHHAVHPTGGKHNFFDSFCRHFHSVTLVSLPVFFADLPYTASAGLPDKIL